VSAGAPIGGGVEVLPDGTLLTGARRLGLRVEGAFELVQRYLAGTPLFETVVVSEHGSTGITDLVWEGAPRRLVRAHTGAARLDLDGAEQDPPLRLRALRSWWERLPPVEDGVDRELRALSLALAAACDAEPGTARDPADVDELGLWRLADGSVDLGAHAAFARA
jgi:hypothetical protein